MDPSLNGAYHTPEPAPHASSPESRLLDLLSGSLSRQEQATREMASQLATRLDKVAGKLDKVEEAVSSLRITPWLVALLALALLILGAGLGVSGALHVTPADVTLSASPAGS